MAGEAVNFVGVMAKLERATELVGDLEEWMLDEYLAKGVRYDVAVTTNWDSHSYTVTVTHDRPPVRGAVLFGDVVHSLRSSLDHLARQLILAHGGIPADTVGGTSFPILTRRPSRLADIEPRGCLPTNVRQLLDSVQPYQRGADHKADPLYRLSELDNIDKHRLLHLTAVRGSYNACFFPASLIKSEGFAVPADARRYFIDLGRETPQEVSVHPDDLYEDPGITGMHTTEVVFAESGFDAGANVVGVARQIHRHVMEVASGFLELC